jgi:hypothetical protein
MTLKGSIFHIGRSKPNVHFTTLIFFLNFQDQSTIYCIIEYDVLTLSNSVPNSGSTDAWSIAKQCDMTTDIEK